MANDPNNPASEPRTSALPALPLVTVVGCCGMPLTADDNRPNC